MCARELTFAQVCGYVAVTMDMSRIRRPINVTLAPELIEELDAWLSRQPYKPNRATFIEAAIRKLLADEKAKEKKGGR